MALTWAAKCSTNAGDIFAAFAQRRQAQRKDVDAMKKIRAKFPVAHQRFEVTMSGDDHADVHRDGAIAADALDLSFFEHAQKFSLHGEWHVADFVEEDGAVLCLLEFAEMAGSGAGERSFFVAK